MQLNSNNYHFSYALYSSRELSHTVNSGKYDYEVFGPNGFFRKFSGNNPDIEVQLIDNGLKNQAELVFRKKKANVSVVLEDLYEKKKKTIALHQTEEKITVDLNKNKGWYDLKVIFDDHIWHFAGRTETGKVSISDPHWT
jgi:phospholipase C